MSRKYFHLVFICFLLFNSCSNDDDGSDSNFYSEAKTSVTVEQVLGTWAIVKVRYEDLTVPAPVNFTACGRDFMIFSAAGVYSEYIFKSSDCQFDQNTLNWTLNKGVITISDSYSQSEQLVLTQISANELVVKMLIDVNEDGKLDTVYAYLQRYAPVKFDVVSNSFTRNSSEGESHLISYMWEPYYDANTFVAYEIYRSTGENCSKNQAELIQTITNINTTKFTDHSPPAEELLCYYLKTKIISGTLGESESQMLYTYALEVKPVNFSQPVVQGKSINFSWEESDSPYFSYYEITYTNFPNGVTGYGQQIVSVAKIYDRNTTTFVDAQPPFLINPKYNLRVYNVFGNATYANPEGYKTTWEVAYQPEELLPVYSVLSYAIDPNEPIVYFYGKSSEEDHQLKIVRYNYQTLATEAISSHSATTSTDLSIAVIKSPEGEELILEQGNELQVYDATSLKFKYMLSPSGVHIINDLKYTNGGYWLLTDDDNLNSYSRSGSIMTLVDTKPHFVNHQSSYNYSFFEIENKQLLVGHKNESISMLYQLDSDGQLSYLKNVEVPIKNSRMQKSQYNLAGHVLLNSEDRGLFSTKDFSSLGSFQYPAAASGMSSNGNLIYGSNNDPSWSIDDTSPHKKEAIIYNWKSHVVQTVPTKGYPLVVFQSPKGDVFSISSGLKKSDLYEDLSYTQDLFIERLEVQ